MRGNDYGRAGSATVTVVPAPGSLRMSMVPPCCNVLCCGKTGTVALRRFRHRAGGGPNRYDVGKSELLENEPSRRVGWPVVGVSTRFHSPSPSKKWNW